MIRTVVQWMVLLLLPHLMMGQVRIDDDINNERIADVLTDWSARYDIDFAFDSYELARYRFSGAVHQLQVDEAIRLVLTPSPFTFRWVDATCIIYPLPAVQPVERVGESAPRMIVGTVTDRLNGERLPFASVGILLANVFTTTDPDGKFTLFSAQDIIGDTLVVLYLGYQTVRMPLDGTLSSASLDIQLIPANAYLPDVEVRATSVKPLKVEPDLSTVIISPNTSALRFGVGESDIFRLAQFSAGVGGAQENSNGLFIRGSSSDQSQLLFDGFNIYHQDHFFGMFSSVNSAAIKSMRVNKFMVNPWQGGRTAGLIELIGKEGDLRKPSGRIDLGSMSISGAIETPLDSSGRASLFICGRRSLTQWVNSPSYKELFHALYSASIVAGTDDESARATFNPNLLFQDVNAKFTYRPDESRRFNVSFYASRDAMNFLYADTSSSQALNVSDVRYSDESAKTNTGMSLQWNKRYSPRLEVYNSVGFSRFKGYYFSTDSIRNNLFALDSTTFSYRDVVLGDWSALHRWTYRSHSHTLHWGASMNAVATTDKQRFASLYERTQSSEGKVLTAFAGDEWTLSRWMFTSVMRYNIYHSTTTKGYWEPRISVRFTTRNRRIFLKAAAARSVQFIQRISNQSLYLNVPDQWQPAGNDFPVLFSDQALLGANYTIGAWNADVEVYYKRNNGHVLDARAGDFTNSITQGYYVGSSRAAGIDVMVQWEHVPHRVMVAYSRLLAQSTYQNVEWKNVNETYNRAYEAKASYEWMKGHWNASVYCIAAAGSPYTALLGSITYALPDGNSQLLPQFGGYNRAVTRPYLRTDVSAGFHWQWRSMRWQTALSVYNLLNTPNYRAVQYSLATANGGLPEIQSREIRMLGRIPSVNLMCQF